LQIVVRFVSLRLSTGELEVLVTTLLDETTYPTQADLLQSFLFFEQSPARMRLKPQLCSANKSVLCP
jgi:hypothetical protein